MKQDKEQCQWAENEHGNWFSGCYHAFTVDYGSPHDNDMMFCPFCGGRLIEHKYNFTASGDVAETPPVAQSPATESPFGWLNNSEAAGGDYSDTPETDEFERATCCGNQSSLDFARKLERGRNKARDIIAKICVNIQRMIPTTNIPLSAAKIRVETIYQVLDLIDRSKQEGNP